MNEFGRRYIHYLSLQIACYLSCALIMILLQLQCVLNQNLLFNKPICWRVCNIYMCNIAYFAVVQTSGIFPILGKLIHSLLAWVTGISDTSLEASSSKDILH